MTNLYSKDSFLIEDYVLVVVFIIHFSLTFFVGFSNPITDIHGFRQTQTALTCYYFLKEGFQINYITPVVGVPWSIPFEFPVYQFIVSVLVQITKLPIDIVGRLVSFFCFYGIVGFVFKLKDLIRDFPWKMTLIFLLVNPIYIFWSRSFLIESMALLLGVWYFYFTIKLWTDNNNKVWYTFYILLFGLSGILLKVTTFIVCLALTGLYVIWLIYKEKYRIKHFNYSFLITSGSIGINFFAIKFWTNVSDDQKSQSYIGSQLTSSKLSEWNFGTLAQRFTWINDELLFNPFFWAFVIVIGIGLILVVNGKPVLKIDFWFFLLVGLTGPLIFFNLYLFHNYYFYANGIFILIAAALLISSMKNKLLSNGLFWGLILFSYTIYFAIYFTPQSISNPIPVQIGQTLKKYTEKDDIILLLGDDWSSEIPYYSERKMVAVPHWMMKELKNDPKHFLQKLKMAEIKKVILVYYNRNDDKQSYFKSIIKDLGLRKVLKFPIQDFKIYTN